MEVNNKRNIATTEMRMLRGILRNEEIRRILHLSVSPIDDVMRSGRLRLFGHVQRTDANNVSRRVSRTPQEDISPTYEGRYDAAHDDGRGCYPGGGPTLEGVEDKDKTDLWEIGEIGERPSR